MSSSQSPFADIAGTTFIKGHGTQNDFVLLADDDSALEMHPETIAQLADRRSGLGSDGVIRIVRSASSGIPGAQEQAEDGAEWFMDYYNHDGSLSEMCGNGVRVFAHVLATTGRVAADSREILVGTRDGIKTVRTVLNPALGKQTGDATASAGQTLPGSAADSWYMIDMGEWSLDDSEDVIVSTSGIEVPRPGMRVETGNPHTVVALAESAELESAELRDAPVLDPVPPQGSNVEYIVMEPARSDMAGGEGALRMRVFERGVGETRSCGTGACAAAIAAHHWAGPNSPLQWRVDVPGGQLRIGITPNEDGTRGSVTLSGPAVLVADGTIS
ncbi:MULTISPECIES: diaminopimelate epimerase [Brevibacterium]|uniref:Diaminopimelate epimerase n=1 Tax=Brevibacterium aurantiacum TaxID=273384 RepID=A0A2H1IC78_BREAU|nr:MULTISPECIES: diaminopimelate epimerase [Brevibacterium]PCC54650.1 diaminopimelate epimerase [Brevibacterium aurantiacum]PCC58504.1 diaminopimelate epimerase [Brevibacterium aurantiacum]RCS91937.1 diaminopimelate epimerase [Brevibacterium aurantiacum]WCE38862.1 diaminopimelate epimerase [Brevibacterium sp. BDJS002]SMX72704.1 diaminopimelate epimerase [Brevibacterium aurantiacum]